MTGRPSLYTAEIAAEICERMADGEGLSSICKDERMPPLRTVRRWVIEDKDGLAAKYARAKEILAEHWASEIVELSDEVAGCRDNAQVQAARLRVDARKWVASKVLPKQYGDRLEHVGAGGKDLIPAQSADPARVTQALLLLFRGLPAPDEPAPGAPARIEHSKAEDESGEDG
jgi:hypothetical protein